MSRLSCLILLVVAAASVALPSAARAVVVDAAPTWPIPSDLPVAQPPIPSLPAAADATPPADQIADPVTPSAGCGAWYLQSSYGGRWPAGSSWWEYRCTHDYSFYYNPCGGPACNAFCPECYFEAERRTDYFYWNGSDAVFYGQDYYYTFYYTESFDFPGILTEAWWDAPTARWYGYPPPPPAPPNVPPRATFTYTCSGLTCSFDGSASSDPDGAIWAGDYDWSFGDASGAGGRSALDHTYARSGTYSVKLTVRDDDGAIGAMTKEVSVEGTPPPPNAPPTASFTYSCSATTCSFNGSASSDPDGTIGAYVWNFGDGSGEGGNGATTIQHTYFQPGTYTAGLTVTDNGGAANTQWQAITVKPNAPPTAGFSVTCVGVRCTFDGSGSSDSDGTVAIYAWSFGDGTTGSGKTTGHDYPKAGSYTLTLMVTDNAGASAATSRRINPISLSARGFKQNGQQKVDLSWTGVAGTSFYVYRDGAKIAGVQATAYTDVAPKGPGSHSYRVCASGEATCSTDATVTF
jgi:PKD repeat protein